jgi:hypothetical protein
MHRRVPDISKIFNLLNFRPTRDIRQIVQSVIEHFEADGEQRRVSGMPELSEATL